MTTQKQAHSEQYERARREFDDLKIEDKAVFLIEATVSTIARGLERAGQVLADELDRMFSMRYEAAPPETEPAGGAEGASAGDPTAASRAAASSAAGEPGDPMPKPPAPGLDPDEGRPEPGTRSPDLDL